MHEPSGELQTTETPMPDNKAIPLTLSDLYDRIGNLWRVISSGWDITRPEGPHDPLWKPSSEPGEEEFLLAMSRLNLFLQTWEQLLSSPLLNEIPGAPHPQVLLRVLTRGSEVRSELTVFSTISNAIDEKRYAEAIGTIKLYLSDMYVRADPLVSQLLAAIEVAEQEQSSGHENRFSTQQWEAMQALRESTDCMTAVQIFRVATGSREENVPSSYREMLSELRKRGIVRRQGSAGRGSQGYSLTPMGNLALSLRLRK